MKKSSKRLLCLALATVLCGTFLTVGLTACNSEEEAPTDTESSTTGTETDTESSATGNDTESDDSSTESETDATPESLTDPLSDILQNVFTTSTVVNETVMFIDYGDAKTLLHTPTEILSVTSYDGRTTYVAGQDYEFKDGKLVILEGSRMPCITSDVYYKGNGTIVVDRKPLYWGEGDAMTKWQVCVNYTHADTWDKYVQADYSKRYTKFIQKLLNGEDVTVYFYGDSITAGANASYFIGTPPYQNAYTVLFLQALAETFNYTIEFVEATPNNPNGDKIPTSDLVCGTRGTITYVNSAVGGWTTGNGLANMATVRTYLEELGGCDLFVLAFGMNDGGLPPKSLATQQKQILNKVLETSPDTSLMVISTMVPHPDSNWFGGQVNQWRELETMADEFNEAGIPCALANMTLVSQAIYETKDFEDCTGNNINHPNDFLGRVYAQTLYQTLIGYENFNRFAVPDNE